MVCIPTETFNCIQADETTVIVSSTFLTQMHSLTPSGTFGFYAAICFIGWILIIFFYPEVSGLTIDETSLVFDRPTLKMVSYARKLRNERAAAGALIAPDPNKIAMGH